MRADCLTLTDARGKMLRAKPWTFRMEHGTHFWLATGRARQEVVEIHFGVIGSDPTILVKDWDYVEKTAPVKEAAGYTYVETPFVRVQPSSITPVAPILSTPTSGLWSHVAWVQRVDKDKWMGLDIRGCQLFVVGMGKAMDLVQSNSHITVKGL